MKNTLVLALMALSLLGFSPSALADDVPPKPPFSWPVAYSVSGDRECDGRVVAMTYTVDGSNSRTDIKIAAGAVTTNIMRGDKQEVITIMNGKVHELLAAKLGQTIPMTPVPPFSTAGVWDSLGKETIDGKPAMKYKVTPSAFSGASGVFYVWLSEDGKIPLRMESREAKMKFASYVIGPQDPKLFEASEK